MLVTKAFKFNECYDTGVLCDASVNKSTFTAPSTAILVVPPLSATTKQSSTALSITTDVYLTSTGLAKTKVIGNLIYSHLYTLVLETPRFYTILDTTYKYIVDFQIHYWVTDMNSIQVYAGDTLLVVDNVANVQDVTARSGYDTGTGTEPNENIGSLAYKFQANSPFPDVGNYDNFVVLTGSTTGPVTYGLASFFNPSAKKLLAGENNTTNKPVEVVPIIASNSATYGLSFGKQEITFSAYGAVSGSTKIFIGTDTLEDEKLNMCTVSSIAGTTLVCETTEINTDIDEADYHVNKGAIAFRVTPAGDRWHLSYFSKSYIDSTYPAFGTEYNVVGLFCPPIGGFYKFYGYGNVLAVFKMKLSGSTYTNIVSNAATGTYYGYSSTSTYIKLVKDTCYSSYVTFTPAAIAKTGFGLSAVICKDGLYTGAENEIIASCNSGLTTDDTPVDWYDQTIIYQIVLIHAQAGQPIYLKINGGSDLNLGTFVVATTTRQHIYQGLITSTPSLYNNLEVEFITRVASTSDTYQLIFYNRSSTFTLSKGTNTTVNLVTLIKAKNKQKFIKVLDRDYFKVEYQEDLNNANARIPEFKVVVTNNDTDFVAVPTKQSDLQLRLIPDDKFPKISSYTFDYYASPKTLSITLTKTFSDATTFLTGYSAPSLTKILMNKNTILSGACSVSVDLLTYTCTLTDFDYGYEGEVYIPEFITAYGRLDISPSICSTSLGPLSRSPYYRCVCNELVDLKTYKCATACAKQFGTTNDNGICDYCQTPLMAANSVCVESCPSGYVKRTVDLITPTRYYCDSCSGSMYEEEGVCVTQCSDGYGVDPESTVRKCILCSAMDKYSHNTECVLNCPLDTIRRKSYFTADDDSYSRELFFCEYCVDDLLAENDKCVFDCTNGYEQKADLTNPYCYSCALDEKYEYNNVCVESCQPYQKKFTAPNYCLDCGSTEVLENNECVAECSALLSIINVEVVEPEPETDTDTDTTTDTTTVTDTNTDTTTTEDEEAEKIPEYRTYCKACAEGQYVMTSKCSFDCQGNVLYSKIRTCTSTCPVNSIKDEKLKACIDCDGDLPVILSEKCSSECLKYQITDSITNRCKYCSDNNKLYYKGVCVNSCLPGYYAKDNIACISCSDEDSDRRYILNGECLYECPYGYIEQNKGNYTECVYIDSAKGCSTGYCLNDGDCDVDTIKGLSCYCKGNYRGTRCQSTQSEVENLNVKFLSELTEIYNEMSRSKRSTTLTKRLRDIKLQVRNLPESITGAGDNIITDMVKMIGSLRGNEMLKFEIIDLAMFIETIQ